MPPSCAEFPAGTRLGNYRLGEAIGTGGMGTVYAARHLACGSEAAIKVLHGALARDPDVRRRFAREARAAARLEHAHAVRVLEVFAEHERPHFAMEQLRGEDLRSCLERKRALPTRIACALLLPVANAIAHAHARGVLHRDLKPENIFLCAADDGTVTPKVLDFGVSKILDEASVTYESTLLGTPSYMSPEQLEGAVKATRASDQYALGVMLYELIVGEPPFADSSLYGLLRAISEAQFTRPLARVPDLDPRLEAVILRAMAREPSARYLSVADFALDLALVCGLCEHSQHVSSRAQRERAETLFGATLPFHRDAVLEAARP